MTLPGETCNTSYPAADNGNGATKKTAIEDMKILNCNSSEQPEKPEIDYPCNWVYKVIGQDPEALKEIILTACAPSDVIISHSHTSSKGKYHSLNASLEVEDETQRLEIYDLLKKHPAIKVVL